MPRSLDLSKFIFTLVHIGMSYGSIRNHGYSFIYAQDMRKIYDTLLLTFLNKFIINSNYMFPILAILYFY